MNTHHRSTLKQQNKTHKTGKHLSKSALKQKNSGKISRDFAENLNFADSDVLKSKRKMNQTNLRNQKRGNAVNQARKLNSTNNNNHNLKAPRNVAVVSLNEDSLSMVYLSFLRFCSHPNEQISALPLTLNVTAWKDRVTLIPVAMNWISFLDAAKVADIILFLIPQSGFTDYALHLVTLLKAQGVPTVMGVLVDPTLDNASAKQKQDIKKLRKAEFHSLFPDEPKFLFFDSNAAQESANQILRFVCQSKLKEINWRNQRPYMLAQEFSYDQQNKSLLVSGYLRGKAMDVNNLIHIPDIGDFQLEAILGPEDPYPSGKASHNSMEKEEQNTPILATPDPAKQQTLQTENVPDPLLNEQTWPTTDEIEEAEQKFLAKKKKKVPKGTHQYQAAWLVDDEDFSEEMSEGEEEEQEMDEMETLDPKFVQKTLDEHRRSKKLLEANKNDDQEESEEESEEESDLEHEDEDLSPEETKRLQKDLETQKNREDSKKKKTIQEMEAEDEEFPDEVDTPLDPPARIRFAKYRGLKSFRTTPWDPKEMLPFDYAKIFQFQNFQRTQKRVMQTEPHFIEPGQWVSLVIRNVPQFDPATYLSRCFILSGLLAYENKVSVLNFNLSRTSITEETLPLRSKDPVTFHFGFRRMTSRPLYSENVLRSDKFKYLRFFKAEKNVVATIFGPITFPPVNVQVFRGDECVAIGNLKNVDPDRMVIKKILLSGIPFQCWGNNAKIKDLFFNPQDVKYFKKIELYTKHGRTGHIVSSVGTHGHAKCVFDDVVYQHDTVMMPLYKRVFPVWPDRVLKRDVKEQNEMKDTN